ncbi:MAG TPA: RNA 2',3'-cyclic phosphodiesterase [Smithellaceae bacterium]|nr:RNA 2',3'-cyclic phosphodiesterase [Smithellaceae bacterium]HRS89295.1 RNA 2',3'-cyclic phosphodiesterase [Smithellaceae bacterium]HRV25165.1 RNA 2',3'-cyclic phosphodiesterase [Smithellaceae bacterium]
MNKEEKNIRAFLAIEPPAAILDAVGTLQEKLKKEIAGKVNWTKAQGNHLTLKFFGNISQNDVKNICAAAEKQIALIPPLSLKIEKTGCFPGGKNPRVLWLGVTGDTEKLAALQARLEEGFENIGFAREGRNFRPHLTLGRIKDPRQAKGAGEALRKYEDYCAGAFICNEMFLFQSRLNPQGAIYTKLEKFSFHC